MLGGVVTLIVFVLPLILEKEKFGGAILCFLLPFLQPTIGHNDSATAATTEQPAEQQAKIFGRPGENDFKIGTSRDKMKYKAREHSIRFRPHSHGCVFIEYETKSFRFHLPSTRIR